MSADFECELIKCLPFTTLTPAFQINKFSVDVLLLMLFVSFARNVDASMSAPRLDQDEHSKIIA